MPFCTPAISLFPRRCDLIHLSDRVNEHHVIVDRTHPLDFEVHSLQQVSGHGGGPEQPLPTVLRGARPGALRPRAGLLQRAPRTARAVQQAAAQGPARSTYVGSETFVALVDANQAPYRHDLRQLWHRRAVPPTATCRCSCRSARTRATSPWRTARRSCRCAASPDRAGRAPAVPTMPAPGG
ncbi:type VI secretion system baseplate subunit TssF [Pseudomonas aeruginosa]